MAHCNSRHDVSLVVLAAGLGRRFGGGKQLAAVGGTGKPLMYFSVMDAWRAGVRKLVLVVSPANRCMVEERFLPLLPEELDVSLVPQRPDDLPRGCTAPVRDKPWGTGHAVWAARSVVAGPFIVINADDYYGQGAWARLLPHFEAGNDWAMLSYPLANTLSEFGAVNRGLCDVSGGYLRSVRECLSITRENGVIRGELEGVQVGLEAESPVSMNIWAFGADVFDSLGRGLAEFFGRGPGKNGEWYLPSQVMASVAAGENRVCVYPGRERWLGMTYHEDLARIGEAFREYGTEPDE